MLDVNLMRDVVELHDTHRYNIDNMVGICNYLTDGGPVPRVAYANSSECIAFVRDVSAFGLNNPGLAPRVMQLLRVAFDVETLEPFALTEGEKDDIQHAYKTQDLHWKIPMIKAVRTRYHMAGRNLGLKDAKDMVEAYYDSLSLPREG